MIVYFSTWPITPLFLYALELFGVHSDQGLRYVPILFIAVLAYWAAIGYVLGWAIARLKNTKGRPNKTL